MKITEPSISRRFPAEWENRGAILLSWPHKDTDWNYMLDAVTDCFVKIAEAIIETEMIVIATPDVELTRGYLKHLNQSRIIYFTVPTNDTWARDFGPITVDDNGSKCICDFKFNGWGLKFAADKDNQIGRAHV